MHLRLKAVQPRLLKQSTNRRVLRVSAAKKQDEALELRICTEGKTCRKQGSKEIWKFGNDLGIEDIEITQCGCLGACGKGPNAVLLPAGRLIHHLATPNDVVELLRTDCDLLVSDTMVQATQLRVAGNALAMQGDLQEAVETYTKAIDLKPARGSHYLLCNRSAALLQLGKKQEALDDALAAVEVAPPAYKNGWVRLIDCHYAVGQFKEAAGATLKAVENVPGFKDSNEYKAIKQALQQAGARL